MNAKKYRWSRVYESAEEELHDFLAAKHITAERHELESYETRSVPASELLTHIWAVEGAAVFTVAGKIFSIQPGDTLDIPEHEAYRIVTSLSEFAWYQ